MEGGSTFRSLINESGIPKRNGSTFRQPVGMNKPFFDSLPTISSLENHILRMVNKSMEKTICKHN